jgi:hypothetical protein
MNKITKISTNSIVTAISSVLFVIILSLPAYGLSPIEAGALAVRSSSQPTSLFGVTGVFTIISNTMLYIIGALSVVMLTIGGLRYVISRGDAKAVTGARNTVLYAVVGLIIALIAYAVVNFVLITLTV